jgi:glycosyltransferase involved in cell wall biosynthesis
VLTGPYLSGLALDVARKFPEKTVLVPCFHDEPAARLPALLAAYREVGAVLYHSPEEQEFARAELGVHRPRSTVCGSWLDTTALGDPDRGRRLLGADGRFLLSCGRRSPHKNVPLLIDFARRYDAARPGRFRFVFVGAGEVVIPHEPWARDLGVLDDSTRRDVAAAADALVQLSQRESLSLAALEAWTQGVPVIVHAGCPVLAGHIERSQGGRTVGDYESFAAALDHLWERPEHWRKLGSRGQAYTRAGFGSRDALADRVTGAIRELTVPLAEVMRQRGLERARLFRRDVWRDRFAAEIERVLDAPPLPARLRVEVEPRCTERTASPNAGGVAVPVRVHNRGTRPAHAEGPARIVLRYRVEDGPVGAAVSLPGLIVPESALPASVWVSVPERTGVYRLFLWAEEEATGRAIGASVEVRLVVGAEAGGSSPTPDVVQAPLAAAERLQSLPADYVDVTTGRFAALKRWLKSKLLNNFRRAYLDVLSRQQSAFNRQVLAVLNELVEWCARLEHGGGRTVTETVRSQWLAAERRCAALEERVARLEAQLQPEEVRT